MLPWTCLQNFSFFFWSFFAEFVWEVSPRIHVFSQNFKNVKGTAYQASIWEQCLKPLQEKGGWKRTISGNQYGQVCQRLPTHAGLSFPANVRSSAQPVAPDKKKGCNVAVYVLVHVKKKANK